jgi:DNA adenine methylase
MRDDKLLDYLKSSCHGRENRKSGRELARTLGINVKDLQKLVKRLRKKKNPIASDQYGYYYAATAAELCDSMDFLQGKISAVCEGALMVTRKGTVLLMAKPFFPWMGNKEKLVPYIHQLIPPHVKQFTEVFGGSGAVILGLQPKKGRLDIYNDLNDDLFNVFCCVKEKSFSLAKELKFLPVHGRTPFAFYRDMAAHEPDFYRHIEEEKRVVAESTCFTEEEIRELLTILDGNAKLFDVRRAAAFLFTTYGSSSGTGNSVGIKTVDPQAIVDKLPQVSRRLDSIFLEHQDALVLISKEDRVDGVIYADPPYMMTEKVYDVRFLPEDHIILHDKARSCKGYVIISYGYHEQIFDLYKDDFFIVSLKRTNPLSQTEGSTFQELIITNYDPSPYLNKQLDIFGQASDAMWEPVILNRPHRILKVD